MSAAPPLPVLLAMFVSIAPTTRLYRSFFLDELGHDYVRTARAKGLAEWVVVNVHAVRNALVPVVTVVGLQLGYLLGGAVVTETVFSWPGMGRLLVESLAARDYPVLMTSFMLMAVLVLVGNLAADLTYAAVDPRIRLD